MSKLGRILGLPALLLALAGISAAQQVAHPSAPAAFVSTDLRALDAHIERLEYLELGIAIQTLPPSPERDYFAGVLANREGRLPQAISLLEIALPQIRKNPSRAAVALQSLGDTYVKLGRYADSVRVYEDLLKNYQQHIDPAILDDDKDDYLTFKLLAGAPPQTIEAKGRVELNTHRHPVIDTIETKLTVNGVTESWILDTGANFSVVTASMAERMKVKLLPGEAQTQGITGAQNKLRIALLPELDLGGAVLRNVVLLVLDDKNLELPVRKGEPVQIRAILGYPVMHALGRITFTRDGRFLADPTAEAGNNGDRLFMQKLSPMLQCNVDGRDLVFAFDSGATSTAFSDRYYQEFPEKFRGLGKHPYAMAGAGGVKKFETYYLPESRLMIGDKRVALKHVPVLPKLGTSIDLGFGNLGRDVTDQFESFTMDLRSMRFELGKPVATPPQSTD